MIFDGADTFPEHFQPDDVQTFSIWLCMSYQQCKIFLSLLCRIMVKFSANKLSTVTTAKSKLRPNTNTSINHSTDSGALHKYIRSIDAMNKRTAHEYYLILTNFQDFVISRYEISLNNILTKISQGSEDPYDVLSDYVSYLQRSYNISVSTLKMRILIAKNFLEYYDVDISPRKFKLKVKVPKLVRQNKEALSKGDIVDILNACSDIKLKTYVMLLAATGMRATEALSIHIKDLDLKSSPAKLFVKGKYTKTRTDR
jgi:integrase